MQQTNSKNIIIDAFSSVFCGLLSPLSGVNQDEFSHLVVPDLDLTVICSWDEVGLVSSTVVVNTVDSFLMALQREIRRRRT